MQVLRSMIILCLLVQPIYLASAADITGTWVSKYSFGSIEEVMTANITQVGEDFIGSFKVTPTTGIPYSGILFGRVEGESVKTNYLTVKPSQISITFTDARLIDQNTIKGMYYVQDSEMNAVSGSYEANKK
jgi:hypothetical protein